MFWFLSILAGLLAAWAVVMFNRAVRLRNQVSEAWAGIDVQLQRRYELVPNLVATVTGYTQHESAVLEQLSQLRSTAAMPLERRANEETGLSRSIGRLFALAESYPDLKASEGFRQLHASLVEIEEHLQYTRRYYNGSVRDNNNLVQGFPFLLLARVFGFHTAAFFEIELASQREAPTVQLSSQADSA